MISASVLIEPKPQLIIPLKIKPSYPLKHNRALFLYRWITGKIPYGYCSAGRFFVIRIFEIKESDLAHFLEMIC
jgi:hypothetical protein